jgi:hypothetical protein
MTTLNFQDLKITNKANFSSDFFSSVESTIARINKYITKKGDISPKQKGEYEILLYAMENEVEGPALNYAISLSRDEMEKARMIIKK